MKDGLKRMKACKKSLKERKEERDQGNNRPRRKVLDIEMTI
jgi:hypothetical protein